MVFFVVETLSVVSMRNTLTTILLAWSSTIVTMILLCWLSLGVGIIGADGDPANRLYLIVLAIVIVGTVVVRCKSRWMRVIMLLAAFAQLCILVLALLTGMGRPYSNAMELFLLNGGFIAMWMFACWCFHRDAQIFHR